MIILYSSSGILTDGRLGLFSISHFPRNSIESNPTGFSLHNFTNPCVSTSFIVSPEPTFSLKISEIFTEFVFEIFLFKHDLFDCKCISPSITTTSNVSNKLDSFSDCLSNPASAS